MPGVPILDRNDPFSGSAKYRSRRAAMPEYDGLASIETQTIRSGNLGTGATTLYTCPSTKRGRTGAGVLLVVNPTGGGIVADFYLVPSGGSAGTTNKLLPQATYGAGTHALLFPSSIWMVVDSGASLVVNTGGAGLNVYGTVLEERSEICAFIGGFIADLPASETTAITVPALRSLALASVVAYNANAAARTLTVHNRASGVAAGTANQILTTSIAGTAGYSFDLSLLPTQSAGGIVSGIGSATNINTWISGVLY